MIDICDFAVGLSRQLYGLTIASERPNHRMMEQWHPLGPVLVISAFNFPGRGVGMECRAGAGLRQSGDLEAEREDAALRRAGDGARAPRAATGSATRPTDWSSWSRASATSARALVDDPRIALVSATGSTAMGRAVGAARRAALRASCCSSLAATMRRSSARSADLELAARAILFSAAGTAGQRCTTLRRLIVHESIADELVGRVRELFAQVKIGDPRQPDTLDRTADRRGRVQGHEGRCSATAIERVDAVAGGFYVRPAIVEVEGAGGHGPEGDLRADPLRPSLHATSTRRSRSTTPSRRASPRRSSPTTCARRSGSCPPRGSDCGIANVNIGPSGAEIGGAFGGEKETGGGRESGSDSWRAYMRRQTNTINYGSELPLAQGIRFDVAP